MDFKELLSLSWKAIAANKLRSFLTTLGIIIGVFAIILLVSIGTGLQKYITDQITGFGANNVYLIPGRVGGARTPGGVATNKLLLSDAQNLSTKLKNLAIVAPVVSQPVNIKYQNKQDKGASVFGTVSDYPKTDKNVKIAQGSFFSQGQEKSGAKVAVIGQTVVNNLFQDKNIIGKRIFIGSNVYTVIGVLVKRGSVFGLDQDNVVVIPIIAAQSQFGITNVNSVYISVFDANKVNYVINLANKVLLKRLTADDYTLQAAESSLELVKNITNILSIALGGIAAISLLVGGIGVANIMLVSVTERTREIGLRKALGAKRIDILKQFLLEAVIISLSGGFIGIVLGLFASYILSLFLVSEVTPFSIILAFGFSVAIGIIFGMAPAIRASKLSPIDALRYE
jgi:putative ABC transport system permease protein